VFHQKGYRFYIDSPTNQQFIVLENRQMEQLKQSVSFGFWETLDADHTVVRFATSWATRPEDIQALAALL
jgi:threonine aldolase